MIWSNLFLCSSAYIFRLFFFLCLWKIFLEFCSWITWISFIKKMDILPKSSMWIQCNHNRKSWYILKVISFTSLTVLRFNVLQWAIWLIFNYSGQYDKGILFYYIEISIFPITIQWRCIFTIVCAVAVLLSESSSLVPSVFVSFICGKCCLSPMMLSYN